MLDLGHLRLAFLFLQPLAGKLLQQHEQLLGVLLGLELRRVEGLQVQKLKEARVYQVVVQLHL